MKQAVITASFRKRLKALRRHFREDDVLKDITRFANSGFATGVAPGVREAGVYINPQPMVRVRARSVACSALPVASIAVESPGRQAILGSGAEGPGKRANTPGAN